MKKAIFNSSSHDEDILKYDGQECEIIARLDSDIVDEEVGDMFNVRFSDGHELHVFADEIGAE